MFDEQPDSGPAHTTAGLAQLLTFAGAVGSRKGLFAALDAQVSAAALVAEVQMGEQQLQLAADGCHLSPLSDPLQLWRSQSDKDLLVATAGSAADKESLRQQFAQQVETLLYLAYKLQLPQLQRVMRKCTSGHTCFNNSLFSSADVMRSVVSARVVDAAPGCGAAQGAIIASSNTELCAFSSEGTRHMLKPLDLSAEQKQPIKFRAEVVEDLFYRKGQIMSVELALFGEPSMMLRLCDVSGGAHGGPEAPFKVILSVAGQFVR